VVDYECLQYQNHRPFIGVYDNRTLLQASGSLGTCVMLPINSLPLGNRVPILAERNTGSTE